MMFFYPLVCLVFVSLTGAKKPDKPDPTKPEDVIKFYERLLEGSKQWSFLDHFMGNELNEFCKDITNAKAKEKLPECFKFEAKAVYGLGVLRNGNVTVEGIDYLICHVSAVSSDYDKKFNEYINKFYYIKSNNNHLLWEVTRNEETKWFTFKQDVRTEKGSSLVFL